MLKETKRGVAHALPTRYERRHLCTYDCQAHHHVAGQPAHDNRRQVPGSSAGRNEYMNLCSVANGREVRVRSRKKNAHIMSQQHVLLLMVVLRQSAMLVMQNSTTAVQ